jgi:low affinity Fe/Cu permease
LTLARFDFAAMKSAAARPRGCAKRVEENAMMDAIRSCLTRLGELTATPAAFGVFVVYFCVWFIFDRASLDWHAVATCATLAMTLFIQRAEHRDTQALQAKIDELLRVHGEAKTGLTQIDREQPEEIEEHRKQTEREDRGSR